MALGEGCTIIASNVVVQCRAGGSGCEHDDDHYNHRDRNHNGFRRTVDNGLDSGRCGNFDVRSDFFPSLLWLEDWKISTGQHRRSFC